MKQQALGSGKMNDLGFKFKYIELLYLTAEGRIKASDILQEILNTEHKNSLSYMMECSKINKGAVFQKFDKELYKKHHGRYPEEKEYNTHYQDSAYFLRLLALDILFHGLYLTQLSFEQSNIPNAVGGHNFFKAFLKLDCEFKNKIEAYVKENWGPNTTGLNVKNLLNQFQESYTKIRYPHQNVEWTEGGYSSEKKLDVLGLNWLINFLMEEIRNWGQKKLDGYSEKK